MNKNQIIALAGVATVAGIAFGVRSLHNDLYERFPEIDRKTIRKAYRKMMTAAMTQKLDLDDASDEEMDEIFLSFVNMINPEEK